MKYYEFISVFWIPNAIKMLSEVGLLQVPPIHKLHTTKTCKEVEVNPYTFFSSSPSVGEQ
jgi:hypothetical protein